MNSSGSKPRLLVLADHWGELGGGEVVAAQLAKELRERFEIAVLTTDRQQSRVERQANWTVYRVRSSYPARIRPLVGLVNPAVLKEVRAVFDRFRPDLVHAWNVHQHLSYASLALARGRGAATVLTFQDSLPFCYSKYHCYIDRARPAPARPHYRARPERCRSCWRHYWLFPPRNRLGRLMLSRYVDQQVSVSRALAAALADNGLPNSQVIHNGLPLEEFPPRPEAVEAVRQRFGLATELIVAGGRMNFFKGQQQALEAFGRLAKESPRAQLVLAGRRDDWFGELLDRRAVELGVAERVVFTDFLPRREFLALLGAGALFANLSMYLDPFPTVNLEAGASGLPVVGTCFGGTPEVVLDGHTGRLVNPYQVDQVTEVLRSLLNNRAERTRLGRNAAERVRSSFPMCAMTEAYARLFDSLT